MLTPKDIIIRRATIKDVQEISLLIATYANQNKMLHRTPEVIVQNLRDFFIATARNKREVLGCASLHIYTDRFAEIKAVAVKQRANNLGIGKRLIRRCLKEAQDLGVPKVFVLTYVDTFFKKLKFLPAHKEELPQKIWEECSRCCHKDNCTEICLARKP